MSVMNAENVLSLIDQVPPVEQARLRQLLAERLAALPQASDRGAQNGAPTKAPPNAQLDKRLSNRPAHDSSREPDVVRRAYMRGYRYLVERML